MTIEIATKIAIAKRTIAEANKVRAHARSLERIDHPHARDQYDRAAQGCAEGLRIICDALVEFVEVLANGPITVPKQVAIDIASQAQRVGITTDCWEATRWTLTGRERTVEVVVEGNSATFTLVQVLDVAFDEAEVEAIVEPEHVAQPVHIESPEQVADAVAEAVDRAKWGRAARRWFQAVKLVVDEDQAEDYRTVVKGMLGVGSFRDLHAEELWRESNRVIAMRPGVRRIHILECIGYLTNVGGVAA